MNKTIKEKLIGRIEQLLDKAEQVKMIYAVYQFDSLGDIPDAAGIFYEWKVGAENLIIRITGESSSHHKYFRQRVAKETLCCVDSGAGILRALKEDLELGFLEDVQNMARAEVFTDFLDIARHLLEHGFKDPAASLAGAVLEGGLRKISEKNDVQFRIKDGINSLNRKLAEKRIYNHLVQKQILVWKEIRNSADHGNFDEYEEDKVKAMIEGISGFLAQHL